MHIVPKCNVALHMYPGSSDNMSESAPDTPRRRFSTCGARPLHSERQSMSETVSAKSTTQAGVRMHRTSHPSSRPHSARRPRSETSSSNPSRIGGQTTELRIFERFRYPAFSKQIPPKESARDENLQTRPSTPIFHTCRATPRYPATPSKGRSFYADVLYVRSQN
jgi:hypothetical protein